MLCVLIGAVFRQRHNAYSLLVPDLCGSDSCYKRMLYVKMCAIAMDLFSRRYFKDHFFRPLIGLSGKPACYLCFYYGTYLHSGDETRICFLFTVCDGASMFLTQTRS